jgi:hypothetical protein
MKNIPQLTTAILSLILLLATSNAAAERYRYVVRSPGAGLAVEVKNYNSNDVRYVDTNSNNSLNISTSKNCTKVPGYWLHGYWNSSRIVCQ